MQGKKWIIGALIAGFVLGNGVAPAQAGILDKVIKGGAIGYVVDATAGTCGCEKKAAGGLRGIAKDGIGGAHFENSR